MLFLVFLLHTKGTHTLILEFLRLLFSLIHSFFQNEVRKNLMVVGYAKRYFEKCFIEKLRKVGNFQNIVFFTVQNLKFSNISEVKAEK